MKQGIVFFGAGPYVEPIIEVLNKNWNLALVVTTENGPNDPVPLFCSKNKISYISIVNLSSPKIINNLQSIINYPLSVLAYFGIIVPWEILDIFELGIINVHPSLLPKYRGATPVQAAILAGDTTTGVTIIKLDKEVDHGPILAQIKEKIKPNDTSDSLYKRLFERGAELLSETLPKYISGEIKPVEQDHSKATFTDRLTRESGLIDLTKPPQPPQLDPMIRAYYPWPGVWFRANLNGVERSIKLLPENRIQVEGKKPMSLKDFANGYPEGQHVLSKLSFDLG